ncbi:hypothetical protein Lqui_0138 [Legionella quinlivanii]|uniref:Uncharacterized protein n=1 Tax=Legionella quinlivanii TaxID=45073 RepID=A0A0W0Y6J4_9GAMM|nr:hypothetical protein [Legionella quinlivanii]KTD52572.1 hypothetical protein Lqui_0138 [Legionella quinlivanii]MCW8449728.1 hypothetical protein [Legionella quinlivanii]SEF70974.1 hypothetical protein SAMN02746093_00825 [Legionella quinlivanii DSM 21216]STY12121.1 Uncharacterised protein [Legionella quinlivanii]
MSFIDLLNSSEQILLSAEKKADADKKAMEKRPGIDTPDLPLPSTPKEPEINIPPKESAI